MAEERRAPSKPERIGRYEVERLLGQGGMGRVWLARDTVLGRRVAIKVLRDDLALPPNVRDELLVRMRHEARAAAAVSHPNIVTLYDMGEDDEVGLFLVFEYVPAPKDQTDSPEEPQSLRDRLRSGAMPLAEVAKLARELGAALAFAHEAGVIHRDIKPENVLFSRTGAKIADFGIARIPESTITRANTVLGTPAYTAPEALSKGAFGPASDQFSLAATLYEAATAARAFGGDDAIVTAGKVSSEPPPPLHESLGDPGVVRALDLALQRGLAKDPADRFASSVELGEAVAKSIEARSGSLPPAILELERTPLSSRVALAERVRGVAPTGETPRPSILIRRRTHRFQNIAAAAALLVIVVLVLIGRRGAGSGDGDDATADASASAAPPTPSPPPKNTASKPPRSTATPPPRPSGSPAEPAEGEAGTTEPATGDGG